MFIFIITIRLLNEIVVHVEKMRTEYISLVRQPVDKNYGRIILK
jgi:hypothetical protein